MSIRQLHLNCTARPFAVLRPVGRFSARRQVLDPSASSQPDSAHINAARWHLHRITATRRMRPPLMRSAVAAAASAPTDVFVLDFDGVLVDSEPEVSMAGFRAARDFWPDHVTDEHADVVLKGLAATRPVIVSGYETMIMARLLAEDPHAADRILSEHPAILDEALKSWGTELSELRAAFESSRNRWMDDDQELWLSTVTPYQNIVSTLNFTENPFYIASSKAASRVSRVAIHTLGLDLPEDSPRLFAGLIPPDTEKIAALRNISERPIVKDTGAKLHFVDDRYETVAAVAADPELQNAKLNVYFADWGYSTDEQKVAARKLDNVRTISLPQFNELLKWALIAGVDDGCGDDN